MDELKTELQELENLEAAGSLDDTQATRLIVVKTALTEASKVIEAKDKDLSTALAQKDHFRTKAEKEEEARIAKEKELNELISKGKPEAPASKAALDVEDYIDISASLEGLDQREKEYLAQQHKVTGKPLSDIRKEEDFQFWQTAYRQKLEKELALKPSGKQDDADKPKSLSDRLASASLEEKEKILSEAGLYKAPKVRPDIKKIGMQG